MADEKLRVRDPLTGNVSQVHEEDGKTICTTVKPTDIVKKILEGNKALRGQQNTRSQGRLIARVPDVLDAQWKREWAKWDKLWGIPYNEFFMRKLDSPDYAKLRIDK